ncbi:unnamed protein product, partial [Mesorhabditis spiculigera]
MEITLCVARIPYLLICANQITVSWTDHDYPMLVWGNYLFKTTDGEQWLTIQQKKLCLDDEPLPFGLIPEKNTRALYINNTMALFLIADNHTASNVILDQPPGDADYAVRRKGGLYEGRATHIRRSGQLLYRDGNNLLSLKPGQNPDRLEPVNFFCQGITIFKTGIQLGANMPSETDRVADGALYKHRLRMVDWNAANLDDAQQIVLEVEGLKWIHHLLFDVKFTALLILNYRTQQLTVRLRLGAKLISLLDATLQTLVELAAPFNTGRFTLELAVCCGKIPFYVFHANNISVTKTNEEYPVCIGRFFLLRASGGGFLNIADRRLQIGEPPSSSKQKPTRALYCTSVRELALQYVDGVITQILLEHPPRNPNYADAEVDAEDPASFQFEGVSMFRTAISSTPTPGNMLHTLPIITLPDGRLHVTTKLEDCRMEIGSIPGQLLAKTYNGSNYCHVYALPLPNGGDLDDVMSIVLFIGDYKVLHHQLVDIVRKRLVDPVFV